MKVKTHAEKINELQTIYFYGVELDSSLFLWAGTKEAKLSNLFLSFPNVRPLVLQYTV